LATVTGGRAIHFANWPKEIEDVDILVSATAAPQTIVTWNTLPFLPVRWNRPLLMIDLAMPRDIDPVFHNLDGVYSYDLDSLQAIAERTLSLRKPESAKCGQLMNIRLRTFSGGLNAPGHRISPR
jgi:glutamyl-tRNA reductase